MHVHVHVSAYRRTVCEIGVRVNILNCVYLTPALLLSDLWVLGKVSQIHISDTFFG